jgi:hypothetical protein
MIEFFVDNAGFRVESVEELKQLIEEGMVEEVIGILLLVLEMSKTATDLAEVEQTFGFTLEGEDDQE